MKAYLLLDKCYKIMGRKPKKNNKTESTVKKTKKAVKEAPVVEEVITETVDFQEQEKERLTEWAAENSLDKVKENFDQVEAEISAPAVEEHTETETTEVEPELESAVVENVENVAVEEPVKPVNKPKKHIPTTQEMFGYQWMGQIYDY